MDFEVAEHFSRSPEDNIFEHFKSDRCLLHFDMKNIIINMEAIVKVINNSFCILEQPKKIFEHAWKELGLDDEENLKACQERIALAEHCQIEENQRLFFNEFGWWIGGPVNAKLERDP